MAEWTRGARPRGGRAPVGLAACVALAVALGSPAPAVAQTTASQSAASQQQTQFEAFLFELMIDVAFEDFLARGGGTADEFLVFLEGTMTGLMLPEIVAAGNGQPPTFAATDDPDVVFEEFLMDFFVQLVQEQFVAAGGGTPAQFQTFLQKALTNVGTVQLTNVVNKVVASDAASKTTGSTTTTTGTTTTGTTTTGTRTTTTGTTGTTTGTRTGTTGTGTTGG